MESQLTRTLPYLRERCFTYEMAALTVLYELHTYEIPSQVSGGLVWPVIEGCMLADSF